MNARKLEKLLLSLRPDILEVGAPAIYPRIARRLKKKLPLALSGFWHAYVPGLAQLWCMKNHLKILNSFADRFTWRYLRKAYKGFDTIVSVSSYCNHEINSHHVGKVVSIPLGIDAERFSLENRDSSLRNSIGADNDACILFSKIAF